MTTMTNRRFDVEVHDGTVVGEFLSRTEDAVDALKRMLQASQTMEGFRAALDTETEYVEDLDRDGPGALRTVQVAARVPMPDGSVHRKVLVIDVRDVDIRALRPYLEPLPLYVWNVDFDYRVLAREGIWLKDPRDLMLTDITLRLGRVGAFYRGLGKVLKLKLGIEIDGKGTTQISFDSTSDLTDEQIYYAALDAAGTCELGPVLEAECEAKDLTTANELGWRAGRARMIMQLRGFRFDLAGYTRWVHETVAPAKDRLLSAMADYCKQGQATLDLDGNGSQMLPPFNPDSDVQVLRALNKFCAEDLKSFFDWFDPIFLRKSDLKRKTKDRKLGDFEGADAQTLKLIANHTDNELVKLLLEFRKWNQILKNFPPETFAEFIRIDPVTGDTRVHGTFHQGKTDTGRWASSKPNMQNQSKAQKQAFLPAEGKKLVQADYSSAEAALIAVLADDKAGAEPFFLKRLKRRAENALLRPLDHQAVLVAAGREDDAPDDVDGWTKLYLPYVQQLLDQGVELSRYTAEGMSAEQIAERLYASYTEASDPHSATAIDMYGSAEGDNRSAAKGVRFGLSYGQRARALAIGLTERGTITTPDEAQQHIDTFNTKAHPDQARYLEDRDRFIEQFSKEMPPCDWKATFRLWQAGRDLRQAVKHIKDKGLPDAVGEDEPKSVQAAAVLLDLADQGKSFRLADEVADTPDPRGRLAEILEWADTFDGACVLQKVVDEDGNETGELTPVEFTSETIAGRKRHFQLSTTKVIESLTVAISRDRDFDDRRDQFAEEHGLTLSYVNRAGYSRSVSTKKFLNQLSDKDDRYDFVRYAMAAQQPRKQAQLLGRAYEDTVRSMGNQYRNHPLQGGVGDIVEAALADVADMLDEYPGAWLVCTVHDSIVAEVPDEYAVEVSERMVALMEDAFARFAPSVPATSDVTICHRYVEDDDSILSDEEVEHLRSIARPAPDGGADPAQFPIAA